MDRRHFITALAGGLVGTHALGVGALRAHPFESIDLFIPAAAGGGWDQTGRAIMNCLLLERVVETANIVNDAAGSAVALPRFLAGYHGRPDTLMVSGTAMLSAAIIKNAVQDFARLVPIARLASEFSVIAVAANSGISSLNTLISLFKNEPSSVIWTGGGAGGTGHILIGMLARATGMAGRQAVYRSFPGVGLGIEDVLAGRATCVVGGWAELEAYVSASKLRALAISAPQRIPGVNIPTLIESGFNVDLTAWRGVFAPPGISVDQCKLLIKLTESLASSPSWRAKLYEHNWTGNYLAGDEFAAFLRDETARLQSLLGELGLR